MIRRMLALVVFGSSLASPLSAQSNGGTAFLAAYGALSIGAIVSLSSRNATPDVEVGSRVKVRLRGMPDWSNPARVSHIDADSMAVEADSTWRFARSEIDSLQVKATTGRWAEGWAIGLLAGGGTGALIGYASVSRDQGGDDYFTPGEAGVIGGVFLGVGGSIVGAAIGLAAPSRWVTIGNPKDARVSIVPTFARPGFVARIQF